MTAKAELEEDPILEKIKKHQKKFDLQEAKRPTVRKPDVLVEIMVFGAPYRCLRSQVPKTYRGNITTLKPQ